MLNDSWMPAEFLMTPALIPVQCIRINIILIPGKGINEYWYFKAFKVMVWNSLAFLSSFPFLSALMKACLENFLKIEVFSQISSTWMMLFSLSYLLHLNTGGTLQLLQSPVEEAGLVWKQCLVLRKRAQKEIKIWPHFTTTYKHEQSLRYYLLAELWLQ